MTNTRWRAAVASSLTLLLACEAGCRHYRTTAEVHEDTTEARQIVSGTIAARSVCHYVIGALEAPVDGSVQVHVTRTTTRTTEQEYVEFDGAGGVIGTFFVKLLNLYPCPLYLGLILNSTAFDGRGCANSSAAHTFFVDFLGSTCPLPIVPWTNLATEPQQYSESEALPPEESVEEAAPKDCAIVRSVGTTSLGSSAWDARSASIERPALLQALSVSAAPRVEQRLVAPVGAELARAVSDIPPILALAAVERLDRLAHAPLSVSVTVREASGRELPIPPVDISARLLDGTTELWRVVVAGVQPGPDGAATLAIGPSAGGTSGSTLPREGTFTLELALVDPIPARAAEPPPPDCVARVTIVAREVEEE